MKGLRILVVDDHDVVREGVKTLLSHRAGFEICGEASSGFEAVKKISELKPDVAVVDLSMPDLNGLEVARRTRKTTPQTEVVILTMYDDERYVQEAIDAGARGYVLKSRTARDLAAAIEAVTRRKLFLSAEVASAVR